MSDKKTDYELDVDIHVWEETHKLMEELYTDVITEAVKKFPKVTQEYITKEVIEAVKESFDWDG